MIALIEYNAGNTRSVQNALQRLGAESIVTRDAELIRSADKVIFPGVGEARSAMESLKQFELDKVIPTLTQPVLGVCLGMQLMCTYSEERYTEGLGIFDTTVKKFPAKEIVPHMGWNGIQNLSGNLFGGIKESADVYFVHSFYAQMCAETAATTDYILPFSAALQKRNFYGTQFHPEKSAQTGERILKNFLDL